MTVNWSLLFIIIVAVRCVILWVSSEEKAIKIKGTLTLMLAGIGAVLMLLADDVQDGLNWLGMMIYLIGLGSFSFGNIKNGMKSYDKEEDET